MAAVYNDSLRLNYMISKQTNYLMPLLTPLLLRLRLLLVALLSPVLMVQALWVRKRTVRLPEPEGQRSGVLGQGDSLSLLILGDSAAAGVGVRTQAEALSGQVVSRLSTRYRLSWELDALTGRTTKDLSSVLNNKAAKKLDVVLISSGVNDITSKIGIQEWLEDCSTVALLLRTKFSAQRIIWSDLPHMEKFTALPQPLRWAVGQRKARFRSALVNWIQQQDRMELLEFPDVLAASNTKIEDWIASDGYHPGEKVYALWAQTFFEVI